MTIFGDGYARNSATGEIEDLGGSGIRFWTLMWDMKHNYGRIDKYQAQRIMSGLYAYDRDTGEKIECAQDDTGAWRVWGTVKACNVGRSTLWGGSADGKVTILNGVRSSVYWTMGTPSHWEGAWDAYSFNRRGE